MISAGLDTWQTAERGRFVLWLPVFMGTGVLAYFALRAEPPFWLGWRLRFRPHPPRFS